MNTALQHAICCVGSQAALARCLGIRSQAVQQWTTTGRAPAERCLALEQATRGKVSRYELRPDVFGPAPARSVATRPAMIPQCDRRRAG
ncbi:MAG: helix-turn-helix domain-containing protein [Gammaproteobacteria bacterium]